MNAPTVGHALAAARSFFLAGVMQGSRRGEHFADQSYRAELNALITAYRPQAEVRDPGRLMQSWVGDREAELRAAHARLGGPDILRRNDYEPAVADLTGVFERLVRLSAASDVCVAWLPDHEASMGTAVEMWAAREAGRVVVAISSMRQNLAVLSCSSVIVPDLTAFTALLAANPPLGRHSAGSGSAPAWSGAGRG